MPKLTIKASKRSELGRKVKRLRKEGVLPANIYGKKVKSEAVSVILTEFGKLFSQAGETNIVELELGKEKRPTLIHNVQKDPITDIPIHVDFLQVDLKQKVTAQIPVELAGESPAEKQGLGTVVQYIDEVEVEALPGDLPDKFEVDLSTLTEVDQMIQVKDLKIDAKKVEVQDDTEQIIAKVEPLREEKEEVVSEAPAEEGEQTEGEGGAEKPADDAAEENKETPKPEAA